MEKITKGHPLTQSPDFIKQNIETLKSLFPTILKEGKIDFEELRALLDEDLEIEDEYYRLTWAGKSMARREATKPSTGTLRPCKEDSKNWKTTQNTFIEGDNLEVLKLLQKSYANKIKMIYIDPPYNTGNDFVYKDDYKDNLRNYLSITDQLDEEGRRKSTNTESDGRYHSNWLSMMYPRLRLARNLLMVDGVIFISIDDKEVYNLRAIMNEIFGEANFLGIMKRRAARKSANLSITMSDLCDYVMVYCKEQLKFPLSNTNASDTTRPVFNAGNSISERIIKKGTECRCNDGFFKNGIYSVRTLNFEMIDDLTIENGKSKNDVRIRGPWRINQSILDKTVYFTSNFGLRRYLLPEEFEKPKAINDLVDDSSFYNENGSEQLAVIFNENGIFQNPKPVDLIKYLIEVVNFDESNEDFYILDFFAGSGTTAHATFQVNADNGGNRKFICVQLPELTDENSEAFKAGYKDIAAIGKERIRRAGEKILLDKKEKLNQLEANEAGKILQDDIKQQIEELKKNIEKLDVGFKVFKLDSSNINTWEGDPEKLEQSLFNAASNIKDNRTEDDILYEILLKYGLDLVQPIEQKIISDKTVFNIGGGVLFICLADSISTNVADGIGKWKEELKPATCKVIFKDTGFTDVEKTNSMQILKRYGIEEVNTI